MKTQHPSSTRLSKGQKVVIFTDLDGTLLDHSDYSFEPALPAIRELRQRAIPLVLCSSKTAAEMRDIQERIGIGGLFISENGGGIHFPEIGSTAKETFVIGLPFADLTIKVRQLCEKHCLSIKTLEEIPVIEFSGLTGLSFSQAEKAKKREFSLPFLFEDRDPESVQKLQQRAAEFGLKITRGGRFFHATGGNDKGVAVRKVLEIFHSDYGYQPLSVGLGDSLNDLPMLQNVNIPIIIPNPASTAPLEAHLPGARVAPAPGPEGWNTEVLEILHSHRPL